MSASRHLPTVPQLRVRTADGHEFSFSKPFHIGRERDCEVWIQDAHVSRKHVEVFCPDGRWSLRDLQSGSGLFVNGTRVERALIDGKVTVGLGSGGPYLTMEVQTAPLVAPQTVHAPPSGTRLLKSFLDRTAEQQPVGRRTLIVLREAFERAQTKQKRRYQWIVALVALAGLCAGGYAYYAHRKMQRQLLFAEKLFYSMKALDVELAGLELQLAQSGNTQAQAQALRSRDLRRQKEREYEEFLAALTLSAGKQSEQDRLILRVTRRLGECELMAFPGYVGEVTRYIQKWKSSDRFAKAIKLAQDMGYTRRIAEEFQAQNLPPQFFYLALQESDFNEFASGPPTYMGIAKGMWQFIPETGEQYGLRIGPLRNERRPDPEDDRHDWVKATRAAARYIKTIYSTDAQASGLLVMASYNWGEQRVIKLLKSMPANPEERNFWKVLEKYPDRLPKETYDYVFYIVSAAVIGENPRLFGFPFDNPLAFLDQPPAAGAS